MNCFRRETLETNKMNPFDMNLHINKNNIDGTVQKKVISSFSHYSDVLVLHITLGECQVNFAFLKNLIK